MPCFFLEEKTAVCVLHENSCERLDQRSLKFKRLDALVEGPPNDFFLLFSG